MAKLQLKELTVSYFKSFGRQQSIDFEHLSYGLYHLTGVNHAEPELGANGIGKSSLLEAIHWALFGESTVSGIRNPQLKNWSAAKPPRVVLKFTLDGAEHRIERVASEITLDGEIVDQESVDRLLNFPSDAFTAITYHAQFAPTFADLKPAQQMEAFSAALNLQTWEHASYNAGRQASIHESEQTSKQLVLAQAIGKLEQLEVEMGGCERRMQQHDNNAKRQHTELATQLKQLLKDAPANRDKELNQAERALIALRQEYTKRCELRAVLAEKAAHYDNHPRKCPTCGRPWALNNKAELGVARQKLAEINAEVSRAKKDIDRAQSAITALHQHAQDVVRHQAHVEQLRSDLNQPQTNPYKSQLAALHKTILTLKHETITPLKAAVAECARAQEAALFWAKNFKLLRLSLIEASLAQLQSATNRYLYDLGLLDWTVTFEVERETTTKNIARNFYVTVNAPHVQRAVPWGVWSGGEAQRLRIALALGFAELVSACLGYSCNVELWDEPTTWLSIEGRERLLSCLAERARDEQRIIIVADHRALDFGGFTGTISLTKNEHTQLTVRPLA